MNALQRGIVGSIEKVSGRHDDPAVYGGPAGDPGLCGPDSVSWKINGDVGAVGRAGTSAIVMELLHPSVMAGVQQLSTYREDPFRRARTTLGYVLTTTFGNTEAATGLIDQVKRIHGYVEGKRPDGVPFRALNPQLLAWVHTMIPWMIIRSYERYNAPLTAEEKDRYLAEQAVIGRMAGLNPRYSATLDYGTCNFSLHLAVMAITAGLARTVAIMYGTNQRTAGNRLRAPAGRVGAGGERPVRTTPAPAAGKRSGPAGDPAE